MDTPSRRVTPTPPSRSPLRPMVILSGALHAVFAVLLVWGPSWIPRRPAMPVYEVQLVSVPVEAPRPPRQPPPPRVEPKPPPPPKPIKAKPVKKPVQAAVEPAPTKAHPAPAPVPEPAKTPPQPERQPDPPAPERQTKATAPTEPGIQLATPRMEAVALKYPFYMNALTRKINENWSPPGAGFAQMRDMLVVFTIEWDGNVRNVEIEQSSGDAFYDQAAVRSVLRASPFPPLPTGYPDGDRRFYFTFSLTPNNPS